MLASAGATGMEQQLEGQRVSLPLRSPSLGFLRARSSQRRQSRPLLEPYYFPTKALKKTIYWQTGLFGWLFRESNFSSCSQLSRFSKASEAWRLHGEDDDGALTAAQETGVNITRAAKVGRTKPSPRARNKGGGTTDICFCLFPRV